MYRIFLFFIFIIFSAESFSQIIDLPAVNAKSHKTLAIDKIERTPGSTVFYLSIVNELEKDAWFCADKQIYIKESRGSRMYFMEKSEGIPACPENHKFKYVGEVLEFKLLFPEIPSDVKEIDLIENCSDNCFYFHGIVLDIKTNNEIKLFERGVAYYSENRFPEALSCFSKIIENPVDTDGNTYTYSMYIVPLIHFKSGNESEARKAFENLKKSNIKDKSHFIEKLKGIDFFSKL